MRQRSVHEELTALNTRMSKAQEQIAQLEEDLQRQRAAYDEQAQAQTLFLSLIDSLPLNVFSKDQDGRFILANRQYCQTVAKPM
jgi:PAS domain-containing protein